MAKFVLTIEDSPLCDSEERIGCSVETQFSPQLIGDAMPTPAQAVGSFLCMLLPKLGEMMGGNVLNEKNLADSMSQLPIDDATREALLKEIRQRKSVA